MKMLVKALEVLDGKVLKVLLNSQGEGLYSNAFYLYLPVEESPHYYLNKEVEVEYKA